MAVRSRRRGAPPERLGRASPPASRSSTGVLGFEDTVLPQLENALLAGHDVILLGERGQAKTRIIRALVDLLDEWLPIVAGSRDQRRPLPAHLSLRPDQGGRGGRRHPDRLGPPLRALRREAGHPRHLDRRPHRRGRPDQDRRGPLPLRRAGAPLRPRAAGQPGHLRHQRAAGPGRADPGGPAERARGARRPDPRPPDPPAARRRAGGHGQPRGLHQPRPDHHPAEGPVRGPDPHPLPARRPNRGGDHARRGGAAADGPAVVVPRLHRGGGGRDQPAGPSQPAPQPAQRRVGPAHDRQLRDPGRQRAAPGPAHRGAGGGRPG